MDLDIRAKYGCNVVAIKQREEIDVTPNSGMISYATRR